MILILLEVFIYERPIFAFEKEEHLQQNHFCGAGEEKTQFLTQYEKSQK